MTCVAGMIQSGKVYIGADSCGSNGHIYSVRKDPKVFTNGKYVIGYTSSFRMGQLLMFNNLPKYSKKKDGDEFKFMVCKFVPAIRAIFKEGGYSKISSNEESGGCFLVGFRGRLFQIESDFQVAESSTGYDACGCGRTSALASLATLEETGMKKCNADDQIKIALGIASGIHEGVRGSFSVLCV